MKRYLPVALLDILENWLKMLLKCQMEQPFLGYFCDKIWSQTRFRSIPIFICNLFRWYPHNPLSYSQILHYTLRWRHTFNSSPYHWIAKVIYCERELEWLDMRINVKKSHCLRIGPRFNISCARSTTSDGHSIPWVEEIRYLGVGLHIVARQQFKCSVTHAKQSVYRSTNACLVKSVELHPKR